MVNVLSPAGAGRSSLARNRAALARQALAECHLCAHHCGVDRRRGGGGRCHAGAHARVFSAQVEVSDEMELIPTFAVAFGGCDLRCDFCITGRDSWDARAKEPIDFEVLATRAVQALSEGARTIMILGGEPTIHLPDVLEFVSHLPDTAPLVWKTNAHGSEQARELLDGIFDYWLADFKFGNDACAHRLAKVENYIAIVTENLRWAESHSELIVRHLVMPGHVECCWRPVAEWLARGLPGVKVNLRSGFWPAWQARRHVELRGTTSAADAALARRIGDDLGLNFVE
jgi:putative pyruvate formate lyase activating enzyme